MPIFIRGSVRLALAHLIFTNWQSLLHTEVLQFVHQSIQLKIVRIRLHDEKFRIRSNSAFYVEQLAHERERHLGQLVLHYCGDTAVAVSSRHRRGRRRLEIESIEAFGQFFRFFVGQRCIARSSATGFTGYGVPFTGRTRANARRTILVTTGCPRCTDKLGAEFELLLVADRIVNTHENVVPGVATTVGNVDEDLHQRYTARCHGADLCHRSHGRF
uniref:Putative secreted protein n=1 Tax=Anopheles darlingi TaxID=43151 RepID=A0A2M4D7C9_ANODA